MCLHPFSSLLIADYYYYYYYLNSHKMYTKTRKPTKEKNNSSSIANYNQVQAKTSCRVQLICLYVLKPFAT